MAHNNIEVLKKLSKKYDLITPSQEREGRGTSHFWNCHGNMVLTNDGCTIIAHKENIELVDIKVLNSTDTLVRLLVTMKKGDVTISTFGEADRNNCKSQYLACMAEKRGHDRAVLKLINAYEYGIYSEFEAEEFKRPTGEPVKSVQASTSKKGTGKRTSPSQPTSTVSGQNFRRKSA